MWHKWPTGRTEQATGKALKTGRVFALHPSPAPVPSHLSTGSLLHNDHHDMTIWWLSWQCFRTLLLPYKPIIIRWQWSSYLCFCTFCLPYTRSFPTGFCSDNFSACHIHESFEGQLFFCSTMFENPGLTKEKMCFFALCLFLCFAHFCVLHISVFCTFLCFAHSPFLPRTLSGQSNRLQLPPPKTEVITNTDQNTNTDTNTETSRDAIKPVSTSSTLNESDPPLVVR